MLTITPGEARVLGDLARNHEIEVDRTLAGDLLVRRPHDGREWLVKPTGIVPLLSDKVAGRVAGRIGVPSGVVR